MARRRRIICGKLSCSGVLCRQMAVEWSRNVGSSSFENSSAGGVLRSGGCRDQLTLIPGAESALHSVSSLVRLLFAGRRGLLLTAGVVVSVGYCLAVRFICKVAMRLLGLANTGLRCRIGSASIDQFCLETLRWGARITAGAGAAVTACRCPPW